MVITKFLPFLFIIVFLSAILGIVLYHKFISLLKENHVEKWRELGFPTLFTNNSINNNLKILSFLKNKKYLDLNDTRLTSTARKLWNYGVVYLFFFIAALFIFLIVVLKRK